MIKEVYKVEKLYACKWTGENLKEMLDFLKKYEFSYNEIEDDTLLIYSYLNFIIMIPKDYWFICKSKSKFRCLDNNLFNQYYMDCADDLECFVVEED